MVQRSWTLKSATVAFVLSILGLAFSALPADAAPSACPAHYVGGERPEVHHARLAKNITEICLSGFAVMYSGLTKTPLWSAYYLTPERIRQARNVKRIDNFAPYPKIPKTWRSELIDYRGTGFDRGHLAPFAVMANAKQGDESFYLINIVPQHAAFNRGRWAAIEDRVRQYASQDPVYVITGALFLTKRLERLNKRVLAPSHLYKLVYSPAKNQTAVFVATNKPTTQVRMMNAAQFERFSRSTVVLPAFIRNTSELKLN